MHICFNSSYFWKQPRCKWWARRQSD